MDKLDLAKQLLEQINMPAKQQSTLCCLALLAMAKLKKDTPCFQATNDWIRIHDIIAFIGENYGVMYAENSRETFRKQAMHPFRTAALIEDNGKATNSPNYRYRITNEFLKVIQDMNENDGCLCEENASLSLFLMRHDSLSEFAPRFAPHSECLYVGDTIQKDMVKDIDKLSQLGFEITLHDKMPDVVLYREDKNWVYFVESVTSVGPMDPKRILEIESMTSKVTAGKIYVTAFLDFQTFKKFSEQLAWETEVWIADMPDHMIHLNGDKFLGPR